MFEEWSGNRMIRRLGTIVLFTAVGLVAEAQILVVPPTITPPNPTSADRIRVQFQIGAPGACVPESSTAVDGTTIRTTLVYPADCGGTQPIVLDQLQEFGPLPAGAYTYQLQYVVGSGLPILLATRTFAVSPIPVPMTSEVSLVILVFGLTVTALLMARRAGL